MRGPPGAATRERLRNADPDEPEQWAGNFVDARTLDEVFGGR